MSYEETVDEVPLEFLETLASLWDDEDARRERQQDRPADWSIPEDLDWNRVEERARRYMGCVAPAVSGQGGHGATFRAACVLVLRFNITPDRAFPILAEWNERCQPPWEHDELMRKLREADKQGGERGVLLRSFVREKRRGQRALAENADGSPPAGGDGATNGNDSGECTRFRNFYFPENSVSERPERIGLSLPVTAARMNAITGGWPKRVGQLLFAIREHRPLWIKSASALFAWLSTQVSHASNENGIQWAEGPDKVKQTQFFDYLTQTAEEFQTVELYPHEPSLAGHCYIHEPLAGGDGQALEGLLSRFRPATHVDTMLIRAFFLSLVWGGLPGQRPAWLFTGEDGDAGTGRGVGKSTIAQLGGRLVGGYVSLSSNESFGDVQRRLLSPVALEKRVVLLDNIKSLRFSWGELEGLITDTMISGRQMHTGEGQRPNTLVWVMTFNGASLSRDLAQRCVLVKLKRPTYVGKWMTEAINFIDVNRNAILGDLVAILQRTPPNLTPKSRWGSWEQDVLAHVEDPQLCQDIIAERANDADDDREEMETLRDAFRNLIRKNEDCDPDEAWVHITSEVAADLYLTTMGEKRATNAAMKMIYMLGIPEIQRNSSRARGRSATWKGQKTTWKHARWLGAKDQQSSESMSGQSDGVDDPTLY